VTFISDIGIGYRVRLRVDIDYRHFPKFTYRSDTSIYVSMWYGTVIGNANTIEENSSIFSLIPNELVAVGSGMQAVKFCCNKLLQFLTGGAG